MQGSRRLRYTQQCNFCNYKFASEHDLIVHQLTHSEKHFSCDRCLAVFSKESQFERHRTVCQGGRKPFVCNDCGDVFKTGQQLDEHHRRVHQSSKIYECSTCSAKFAWHDNLLRHERMHKTESCVCKICGAIFGSSASVKVHLWKAHNQVLQEEEESSQAKPFVCNFCKKSFRFAKNLKIHVCVGNSKSDSATNSSSDKPFHCGICDKSFKYDFSYDAHMKCHGESLILNQNAEKGPSSSNQSVGIDEDPERPHKCDVCGIGFKYDFSLMAHMKTHADLSSTRMSNGSAENQGPITMAQFAEMIHHGLMNDDDEARHGSISIEPVDDRDGSALSVEMYDFSEQDVTMLPVSQLPSGLLNLLFQQPDQILDTSTSSSSDFPNKSHTIPASSSGIVSFQDSAGGMIMSTSSAPSCSASVKDSVNVSGMGADIHQEQDKDQIYTIHSVILDGMRLTTNQDETCLEEL